VTIDDVFICCTGVEATDLPGVGDTITSIADNAGEGIRSDDGIPAKTGVGATMGDRLGVGMKCL